MKTVPIEVPEWFANIWQIMSGVPWFLAIPVFLTLGAFLLLAIQLWRFGPAIKKLNKLEVLSQLHSLGAKQSDMTDAFGEATGASKAMIVTANEVRKALDDLREFVIDLQEKNSEYNADKITQARLEDEQPAKKPGVLWQRPSPPQSEEQLFESMKKEWSGFLDVFRARLEEANVPVQLNRIGKMTYMLADGRRKFPLPVETADLITALHSQYKRHIALQRISATEHSNFVQLVKTAILEVQKKTPRPEATTSRNGNGADQNETQLPLM
jgi:hypothetical protein